MGRALKNTEAATTVRVEQLQDGQVSIPVEFQQAIGAGPDDLLAMQVIDGEIRLKRVGASSLSIVNPWFRELYDYFAPFRAWADESGMSDDEINEAIDEALQAVRAESS